MGNSSRQETENQAGGEPLSADLVGVVFFIILLIGNNRYSSEKSIKDLCRW